MGFIKRIPSLIKGAFMHAAAVKKETGIPMFFILCDMALCIPIYGTAPDQYRHFGFAHLKPSQRRGHMNMYHHAAMEKKFNSKRYEEIFLNKYYFSKIFNDNFCRFATRTDMVDEAELKKLGGKFVYKPLEGQAGDGVRVFKREDAGSAEDTLSMLRALPRGVLEEHLVQHKELNRLYPGAVNPIRVATVFSEGKCHFIYGTLTLGVGLEFANASKDALFALIDVKTGEVVTNGVDYSHNGYITHPVTGQPIKGFMIPHWDMVLEMLSAAAARVPEMGYISWDVAITPERPVLIEGNSRGGYTGYQFYEFFREGIDTETAKYYIPFIKSR